jgi:hypothetical protein
MADLGSYRSGAISDETLNVMANSDEPTIRAQAQAIIDASKKQQQQLGFFQKLGNFLGNTFGMSKAGAAEPDDLDMLASLKSNQIGSFNRPNMSDIAGITNTPQASLFTNDQAALLADTDDAGIEEEYYEQFPETGTIKSGIQGLFNKVKGSRLAQAFLGGINPIFGGIVGLLNTPGLSDFRKSSTFADFLQARRDRKAREEAAKIGAAKQKEIIAGQQVDTGDGIGGETISGTFGASVNDPGSFSDYS